MALTLGCGHKIPVLFNHLISPWLIIIALGNFHKLEMEGENYPGIEDHTFSPVSLANDSLFCRISTFEPTASLNFLNYCLVQDNETSELSFTHQVNSSQLICC